MGAEQLNRLAAAFGNEFERQISRRVGFEGNRFATADAAAEESEDRIIRRIGHAGGAVETGVQGRQSLNGMPRRRVAEAFGDGRKANPHQRISMMTTATTRYRG